MTCTAPTPTTGGAFSCAGTATNFGDTCDLDCDSSSGYTGDAQISCSLAIAYYAGDETVDWNAMPSCTRKLKVIKSNNMFTKLVKGD